MANGQNRRGDVCADSAGADRGRLKRDGLVSNEESVIIIEFAPKQKDQPLRHDQKGVDMNDMLRSIPDRNPDLDFSRGCCCSVGGGSHNRSVVNSAQLDTPRLNALKIVDIEMVAPTMGPGQRGRVVTGLVLPFGFEFRVLDPDSLQLLETLYNHLPMAPRQAIKVPRVGLFFLGVTGREFHLVVLHHAIPPRNIQIAAAVP